VKEGKNNGLIVDYCGILKNLRKALATYAGHTGDANAKPGEGAETDPLHPEEELLADLADSIALVRSTLSENGFDLDRFLTAIGFEKNKALVDAKEAINVNDETRKQFELMARAVFRKYKACLTFKGVFAYREPNAAIGLIYNSLQDDRDNADISLIMRELNAIVSDAITIRAETEAEDKVFDISRIDFDRLRREFEKSPSKNSVVQDLREAIEKRLRELIAANPTRTNFQDHFDEIVQKYNQEKDKNVIEATFEALMRLVQDMDAETRRGVAEGLDEEQLAIYDLLLKPDISKPETERVKKVAVELLKVVRARLREVQDTFAKEATRDNFRQTIYDFLWGDSTGLPSDVYVDDDIAAKTDAVFGFFYSRSTSRDADAGLMV
jgi:type I restriction enzyme R subunit